MAKGPVIALAHGGGPLPVLGDKDHESIIHSLKTRVPKLLGIGTASQPRAIVLVTAHWTTDSPRISSSASHSLMYDYYGFPKEAYSLQYPAAGQPELAKEIHDAMVAEGLQPVLDEKRPWDHGVYVPMLLVNPKADVPIVQVSVLESEDPTLHLRMGAALSNLRDSNIAIVGSGFASFHNLDLMRQLRPVSPDQRGWIKPSADRFNGALQNIVTSPSKDERWKGLQDWRSLPDANSMHPPGAGEHFLPLIVCCGAAEDGQAAEKYTDEYLGVDIFTYYWRGTVNGDLS